MTEDQKSNAVMQAFLRIAVANYEDELSDEESKAMYRRLRMLPQDQQADIHRMVDMRRRLADDIAVLQEVENRLVSGGAVCQVLTGMTSEQFEEWRTKR